MCDIARLKHSKPADVLPVLPRVKEQKGSEDANLLCESVNLV